MITDTSTDQSYPDHPDRFNVCQVLCRESVCGRCYRELEFSGCLFISVSYKSIRRKGLDDSVCLDIMISPRACAALPPVTHSDTIT